MTRFIYSTTTVTLATDPVMPLALPRSESQADGLVSSGARYVYQRSVRGREVSLSFATVTAAELAAYDAFTVAVSGAGSEHDWLDQDDVTHYVRYLGHEWQRTGVDRYRLAVRLAERGQPLPVQHGLNVWGTTWGDMGDLIWA